MTSKTLKLGEISRNASRSFDFSKHPNVVFVNTGDVLEGEFLHQNITNTQQEQLPGQAKKAIKKGDILYSEIRPGNKRYVYIDRDLDNYVVSTKFMVIESNENIVDSKFLYYCLIENKCEETFKTIADSRSGTFPQITFDSISFYEFEIPSKENQKVFVYIADNITNKIRLNHGIIQNLESLAQSIFKSWFINFDPVHAKKNALEAGLTNLQAERASMAVIAGICSPTEYTENTKEIEKKLEERLASIGKEKAEELKAKASLFPSCFEDSELDSVPKGWEVKPIKDLANVINGRAYKNDEFKTEGTPIVRIQNLSENGGKTVFSDLDLPEDKLIDKGDLIYAWSATFGPHIWKGRRSIYHYHIWKMVVTNYVCKHYLYLSLSRMTEHLKAQGTGSIFTHLTKTIMEEQKMLIPDEKLAKFSASTFESLFKLILQKNDEIKMLQELRDTLLPKLLSGEINLDKIQIESESH